MPLYRWNSDNLEAVPPTTFEAEQLQERADLQRLLRDQPEVLEEGLVIVAEEFSNWQDSNRSIDLLVLDRTGRLVVIELKRTQTGDYSELQAIRYAAMVSNMTQKQLDEAHRAYLLKRGIGYDGDGLVEEVYTESPRIMLVSAGFSKELTTSVLWLNDNGLEITCIRLRLYRSGDEILMDTDQVIPLPEATEYLVQVREREVEGRSQRPSQPWYILGGDAFRQTINSAPERFQPTLNRMYQWAVSLEKERLAVLDTHLSDRGTATLRAVLPGSGGGLVTLYNSSNGSYIQLWKRVFDRACPKSIAPVEELIGSPLTNGKTHYDLSDDLLMILTEAYREANERLTVTTPPPDSAPGSPAPAE